MTKWQPGQSGNPGGRPRETAELRELARQYTTEAIQTLVSIMQDKDASPTARCAAANALLDRGFGRATQGLSIETDAASFNVATALDAAITRRERDLARGT